MSKRVNAAITAIRNNGHLSALLLVSAFLLSFPLNSALALLLGIGTSVVFEVRHKEKWQRLSKLLLQVCVIGLGAGMDLTKVLQTGSHGFVGTALGIAITLGFGALLGRFLMVPKNVSVLISVGTAICGGSAIAAVGPVIGALSSEMAMAFAVVFLLNGAALFIFPYVGQLLNLSQQQFGWWAALAIHDTSSVVGATIQYGTEALNQGVLIKLTRALWIVPVTLMFSLKGRQRKVPWQPLLMMCGFLAFSTVHTAALHFDSSLVVVVSNFIFVAAKKMMIVCLFLIGTLMDRSSIQAIGWKAFLQGFFLWLCTSIIVLWLV